MVGHVIHQVSAEACQVAGNGRHAASHALHRRIAPRLVRARENAQMAAAHKLVVIHSEQRVVGVIKSG